MNPKIRFCTVHASKIVAQLIFVAAAAVSIAPRPASAEIFVGAGREEITPPIGFPNSASKHIKFEKILSPLYARALVLSDGTRKIALLQWDLADSREDAVAKARELVSAATGIPAANILVIALLSHSGPGSPHIGEIRGSRDDNHAEQTKDATLAENWADRLFSASVTAAKTANASLQPVTLEIGRANVPEWQFNRRARRPNGKAETITVPLDPYTMPDGLRFGPVDPTLTVLAFRNRQRQPVVTLFNYPCEAVCSYITGVTRVAGKEPDDYIYAQDLSAICADWPGYAVDQLESSIGGRAIFLQGCSGDLVPARRGPAAAKQMGALVGTRAAAAAEGLQIDVNRLEVNSCRIGLPLNVSARAKAGTDLKISEVQTFVLGPVAIVALPGLPMIGIAQAIQKKSPYPHTIVLGASNGDGVYYVGMPGEVARGGHGTEEDEDIGGDECGGMLVDTSLRLLREIAAR